METQEVVQRPARLAALRATGLLDSEADEVFDRLTRLAVRLLGVPTAFISLVDEQRDFYMSAFGFGEPLASAREMTGLTFCHHAIGSTGPLVIPDAAADPRYSGVPTIRTLGVAAYVGVPLVVDGEPVGSFCVVDARPHPWDEAEIEVMSELAASAQREIQLRVALRRAEAARAAAAEANRAKDDFLAQVSHELRSPLNGIASNVQMMEMGLCGPLSEGQARALERIGRAQGHLLGLITQILDYKKLTVGGPQYDLARVSAATALADAATLVESEIERRGLRLERGDDGRAIAVLADPGKLRQILVNLLANAVKFTPSGGVVTLAAEDGGPRVCFHVRDTGAGIPGDALERIFEPFVQLRQSPMTAASGTGLGLAISRELARGMGGDLTVQSAVGAGSTFTLHLPAAPPDP